MPTVLGPVCLTESRPLTLDRSTSALIPFADSLFSTLEKLQSLIAFHGAEPYNEFFKTGGTMVNLHEPAKMV